jgi:hypothetical protein
VVWFLLSLKYEVPKYSVCCDMYIRLSLPRMWSIATPSKSQDPTLFIIYPQTTIHPFSVQPQAAASLDPQF